MAQDYRMIETWNENDLLNLPSDETDFYEYKSSKIKHELKFSDNLKEKLFHAASAFWNTGGGIFIVGIGNNGKIDGGIPEKIGRQKIRDWVDQILREIQPNGNYVVQTIRRDNPNSTIDEDCVVLAVSFDSGSPYLHMAPDNRYYVRAGAHSVPASHYLVEALRSRKTTSEPVFRGLVRVHPQKQNTIELLLLNLTDIPALDVILTFDPLPKAFFERTQDYFPLKVPVIDRNNPFRMDISLFSLKASDEIFGRSPVELIVDYADLIGRKYQYRQQIKANESIGPIRYGSDPLVKIAEALEKLITTLK